MRARQRVVKKKRSNIQHGGHRRVEWHVTCCLSLASLSRLSLSPLSLSRSLSLPAQHSTQWVPTRCQLIECLCVPQRALPTGTNVGSGASHSEGGTSGNLSNSGYYHENRWTDPRRLPVGRVLRKRGSQGYFAHKEQRPSLGPGQSPVRSQGGAVSYQRGTTVA